MEAKSANIASQECYVCSRFSVTQKIVSAHHLIYYGVDNLLLLLFLINFANALNTWIDTISNCMLIRAADMHWK